ncbi:MAG TPA: thioredoxin family protein [Chthoniobacteraceae bacterium]|nr:thioredoxin family protein [Chthoniobacteraceae bacterium]
MARTASTMLALGTPLPAFTLPDVTTGQPVSSETLGQGKALLVAFLCNHCPYVIHVREQLAAIARDYADQPVAFVGITSNDVENYPDDSPEATRELAALLGFPILYDESQEVAKTYTAACTPDFFLFNADHRLAYRGQLDSTRPRRDTPPTGNDLRAALDEMLAGKPVTVEQKPSVGCNIKWKPGNEPGYFASA